MKTGAAFFIVGIGRAVAGCLVCSGNRAIIRGFTSTGEGEGVEEMEGVEEVEGRKGGKSIAGKHALKPAWNGRFRPPCPPDQYLSGFPAGLPANARLTRAPALPGLKRPKDVGLWPVVRLVTASFSARPPATTRTQRPWRIFSSACHAWRIAFRPTACAPSTTCFRGGKKRKASRGSWEGGKLEEGGTPAGSRK